MNLREMLFFSISILFYSIGQFAHAGDVRGGSPSDNARMEADIGGNLYFVGLKPWATTWDVPLMDVKTVVINPVGPVLALQEISSQVESDITTLPILFLGVRRNDWTLSASYSPGRRYSTSGLVSGDVSRREMDVNIGYSFAPNIMGSLIYKKGEVDHILTDAAATVYGGNAGYSISAILAGLSVSAPLIDDLSIYGNFAIGPAVERTDANQKYNGTYKIVEVGVSKKIAERSQTFKGLTIQLGYRFQSVAIQDIIFNTYSIPGGAILSQDAKDVSSNTHGFVLSMVGVF